MNISLADIQAIKGIAIILIVIFHLTESLPGNSVDYIRLLLFQGVGLFVISSGYGLRYSVTRKSSREFLIKRFKGFYPKYIIVLLSLFLLINYSGIALFADNPPVSISSLILHLTGLHILSTSTFYDISAVFWYIGLFLQIVFFAVLTKRMSFTPKALIGPLGLAVVYILVVSVSNFDELNRVLRLGSILVWLIPLIYGAYILENKINLKKQFIFSTLLSVIIFVSFIVSSQKFGLRPSESYYQTVIDILSLTIPSIPIWLGCLLIFPKIKRSGIISRIFVPIGNLSYEIYLTHLSFIAIVFLDAYPLIVKLLIYAALVFVVSLLLSKSGKVIDKISILLKPKQNSRHSTD